VCLAKVRGVGGVCVVCVEVVGVCIILGVSRTTIYSEIECTLVLLLLKSVLPVRW
jgi:hypothetical protein